MIALSMVCCGDNDLGVTTMRINHHQQTAFGEARTLVYLIQEDADIGTENWTYFYSNITGFEYEPGFVHELKVLKTKVDNPPADGSSISYVLDEIISTQKVADDVIFDIILKHDRSGNSSSFVNGSLSEGFELLYEHEIDCGSLCNDFIDKLEENERLVGTFSHGDSGTLVLEELKSN